MRPSIAHANEQLDQRQQLANIYHRPKNPNQPLLIKQAVIDSYSLYL